MFACNISEASLISEESETGGNDVAKMIFLPAMAVGLMALYLISRNRRIEFELETKMEPREPIGGGTMMEAGIE